jgi:uncharacterized membrane protein HdeD (DUF308 family)
METRTYKNWWVLSTNGILSIAFGLLMLFCTEILIHGIILYFGIALLLAGLVLLAVSVRNIKKDKKVGMVLLQSVSSVAIGLAVILAPKEDIVRFFFLLIGVWAIILGIFQVAILVNLGKSLSNKNILLFNGLLTMALGLLLCLKPLAMMSLMAHLVGALAVLFGIIMIYLSLLLRKVTVVRGKEDEPHVL